jgi:predicted ferric reductase
MTTTDILRTLFCVINGALCGFVGSLFTILVYKWIQRKHNPHRVAVVRCNECVYAVAYREKNKTPEQSGQYCALHSDLHRPNFYCADGEKKGDANGTD